MEFTVLEKMHFTTPEVKPKFARPRYVKDYEIDYNFSGGRTMTVDGVPYKIKTGDVCFRRPGQTVMTVGVQSCFLLTLDLTNSKPIENFNRNTTDIIQPIYESELFSSLPTIIRHPRGDYFSDIFRELALQPQLNSDTTKYLIKELLFLLNACVCRNNYQTIRTNSFSSDVALRYLTENFDKKIDLTMLAQKANVDKSYLIRLFKKDFGYTPIEYLIKLRMEHAQYLILNTNLTINEVARLCGYNTPSFFIEHYKKKFGKTPKIHRAENLI